MVNFDISMPDYTISNLKEGIAPYAHWRGPQSLLYVT